MPAKRCSFTARFVALTLLCGLLAACGSATAQPLATFTPQALPTEAPPTQSSPTEALPTQAPPTQVPPAATVTPAPTPMPPAPTAGPAAPTAPAGQMTVQIVLIAVGDNGQSGKLIGCGDSAVPVTVPIAPTEGVLRAALNQLLGLKEQYYGQSGLYNALYQSNLRLDNVSIQAGTAIIELSGTLMLAGECDNPRVQAQLEETALQFNTVHDVSIWLNGQPLDQVLSLQG